MQSGDINNKAAPYIGFDIDSLLFRENAEPSVWTRLRDMFKTPDKLYINRPYNQVFVDTIRRLWQDHNISIVFLTGELAVEDLEKLEHRLDRDIVPFTHLYCYEQTEDLRSQMGTLQYFFSGNSDLISFLSVGHALPFHNVKEVFG